MAVSQTIEPKGSGTRHSMWQAVARSVRDNVIAEFVVQGVRLGGFVMLARALGPGQFGIFRVLLVLSVLAALSNDAGIPDALALRRRALEHPARVKAHDQVLKRTRSFLSKSGVGRDLIT